MVSSWFMHMYHTMLNVNDSYIAHFFLFSILTRSEKVRDTPQHCVSPEDLAMVKKVVSNTTDNIIMLKQGEDGWTPWPGDEDALRRFRTTAFFKMIVPRDTNRWTDVHLENLSVALRKTLLFFTLDQEWVGIHYR